jgi:hypothetical protein
MENVAESLPHDLFGTLFITVHPESIAASVLSKVQLVIAAGSQADQELKGVLHAGGLCSSRGKAALRGQGSVVVGPAK